MIQQNCPLVLGSRSPRRSEILRTLAVPFRIIPGQTNEERRLRETPDAYLRRVVMAKLRDVALMLDDEPFGGVLVADTIVVDGSELMGKPHDGADAHFMLRSLSGRTHEVFTRFALASSADPSVPVHEETVRTAVQFRELTNGEITRYVATGEGLDKAGAYAAQGVGSFAISRIEGSYSNVVGLPACEVVAALCRTGLLAAYPL